MTSRFCNAYYWDNSHAVQELIGLGSLAEIALSGSVSKYVIAQMSNRGRMSQFALTKIINREVLEGQYPSK